MEDAATIARRIKSGATTAVAECRAALERAEAAADLNAFTALDPDGAIRQATAVDTAVSAGSDPGPLAGVPVVVKDLIDQAGIPTTAGSSFLRRTADTDAKVVRLLRAAGAVVVGRTGLHEFAYGFSSENDWWGPVRNPWDLQTSPGGSSGGSAAAVAASIVPIGIGTDTGGSVRVPAAMCGVVGLKVTHGRIPLTGVFPLAPSLDTVGPITRDVGDAAIAYRVMAQTDSSDPWSRSSPTAEPDSIPIERLRVGIPHPWVDRPLDDRQHAAFDDARGALGDLGAALIDLEMEEVHWSHVGPGHYHEVADIHRLWFTEDPTRYGPSIRDRLGAVLDLDATEVAEAARTRAAMRQGFADAFRRCDVLLTPTTAVGRKELGVDTVDAGDEPEPYRRALSWFTPPVNLAGLPAIALPVDPPGRTDGPPGSIQLIGPPWSEHRLLALGASLEREGLVVNRPPPHVAREPA